jgi:hypothetical protein
MGYGVKVKMWECEEKETKEWAATYFAQGLLFYFDPR